MRRLDLLACVVFVVAGCGEVSGDPGASASGGSANAGDGGASGSGGANGAATGSGGADSGAGGATPDPDFPPRSLWQPGLSVGTPGWKDSPETFCSDLVGTQQQQIWSAPGKVYALIYNGCVAQNVALCNQAGRHNGQASTLYVNEGMGFRQLHRQSRATTARRLNGFRDGRVVFGTRSCYATVLNQGEPTCLIAEQSDDYASELRTLGDSTVLVLTTSSGVRSFSSLLAHDGASEVRLPISSPGPIFLATNRERILIGDYSKGAGFTELVPQAPLQVVEGTPTTLQVSGWLFDDGEFALLGYDGVLTLYRNGAFETVETGFPGDGTQLWGAPDKTLFAISPTAFARLKPGGTFETILSRDATAAEPGWRITGLWGNDSSEVFLSIDDPAFQNNACGTTVLAWFDGTELHQL